MGKKRSGVGSAFSLPHLVVLALCFLAGVVLGQVVLKSVPDRTGEELRRYLEGFVRLLQTEELAHRSVFETLALYFRYPLLAFLGGCTVLGVAALPVTAAAFGFFLSFAVCCLAAAFGPSGVVLALALMGLRCALTLPSFFLLAVPAFSAACGLGRAVFGRDRRMRAPGGGRADLLRLGAVSLLLLAGACVDILLSPHLAALVLPGLLG